MTNRRNRNLDSRPRDDDPMSDTLMDQAYGQRARGGWRLDRSLNAGVIIALIVEAISGIWFMSQQSALLTADHASIIQLQTDEKDNDKQRVEILLHLSNMDQSLKDILNYGLPRNAQVYVPPTAGAGNTIIQQAPSNQQQVRPWEPSKEQLSVPGAN
jgi:hypothetical protein